MSARRYAATAAVLGLGAPLGLLAVRHLVRRSGGTFLADAAEDVECDLPTYVYVTVSTVIAFGALGFVLGHRADQLARLSRTDPLTGLGNARELAERFDGECARSRRHGTPLSLLLLDLDHLKGINDRRGHTMGDVALLELAEALRSDLRRSDVAARLGGDEFALLAPATSGDAALALAERIRTRVGAISSVGATVSVGVATREAGAEPCSPRDLTERADRALYRAKDGGRNRVETG
jgi:diguanylate cyclase (GGDEF)-like protein